MKDSRTKNFTRNVIYGLFNKFTSIALPFVSRTIFIQKIGVEYLGLNSLFVSILQVLNLTELGFGSALVYSMYKPAIEKDTKTVNYLLRFYRHCYRIIGVIIAIIGLLICPFIHLLINNSEAINVNFYIIFLIYLLNTVISYLFFSYKQSLFIASQRSDIVSNINTASCILQNSLQLAVLFISKNYYHYVLVMIVSTLFKNILLQLLSKRYYPEYTPGGAIDSKKISNIKKNVRGMFYQKIGSIVLANVDSIVISAFLGVNILGIYNNYYYIITSVIGIIGIAMDSLKASVGNSIILESVEKNYNDFKMINFMYIWITTWFSVCIGCLLQNFVKLWLGEDLMLDNAIAISLSLYFFIYKWCDITYVYQEADGLWWQNRFVPLIGAAVNLILNVILVNIVGLYGIIFSTIISLILVNNIGFAVVLFKHYFKNKKWLKQYIINQVKYLAKYVAILMACLLICSFLNDSIESFIFKTVICIILPNILLFGLNINNAEFKKSIDFIDRKYLKRRKV